MVTQKTVARYLEEPGSIAKEAGVPVGTVKKVLRALEVTIIDNRRQPAPEPPAGSISQSEGARKYGVPQTTISGWVRDGIVPVMLNTGYKVFISEDRLAEVVKAYKKKPGRGCRTVQHKFRPEAA